MMEGATDIWTHTITINHIGDEGEISMTKEDKVSNNDHL